MVGEAGTADHDMAAADSGEAGGTGAGGTGAGWGSDGKGRRTRKPQCPQNWPGLGFPHHGHVSSGFPAGAIRAPHASQKSSVSES